MKKSGKDRLKCVVYESTLSTADAVPLPRWGRQRNENTAIPKQSLSLEGKEKRRRLRRISEKILFEYVFSCAFVNDSGNFLNNNIEMIHDLKIGISNNEDSELF